MAAPLKISARVEIDAARAKEGATTAASAVDSIGAAAERNTTKLQALINASVGLKTGAANSNVREWTGALSMQGKSLDELRSKYNPLFATISQYKANLTEIRTLNAQGVLSTNEMTAAIQRQRQAALASIDAIKGRGQALSTMTRQGQAATGAMFQLQDIGVTAAMGMDPRMIGLQQGTQLAGGFAGMSVKQAAATMGGAFTQLLSPISIAAVGLTTLTAAGIQFAMTTGEEVKKLDDVISAHDEHLKRVERTYVGLSENAKRYAADSAGTLLSLGRSDLRSIGAAMRTEERDFFDPLGGQIFARNGASDWRANSRFEAFARPLQDLRAQARAGKPDFDAFYQSIHAISTLDPGYVKQADELTLLIQKYQQSNELLKEQERLMRMQQARVRGTLIGSGDEDSRNAYLDEQRLSLQRMQREADARRTSLFARSPQERAAAARQMESAQVISGESAGQNRLRIDLAGIEALTQAEKELSDARRDRSRALSETMGQQQLDISLIGKSIAEQERLRMEYRLTSELKAEAERNGTAINEAELAQVKQLSAEYGRLAEQMVARRALDGQDQELAALKTRLTLTGLDEQARAQAIISLETERRLREMGIALGSREAEQYREKARLIGEHNEQLRKQEAAWSKVRGTAENSIDTIVDRFSEGDYKGAIEDIAKDWSKSLLQLGVANPAKNGLLGTNHETIGDIGGLGGMFSKLFGSGMSTGAMSVTAATVNVNGGIGSSIGNVLGAANDNKSLLPLSTGTGSPLSFVGKYKKGVDPRLTDILNVTAQQFPGFKVDAMSGFRAGDPRFHGKGLATDVQLTDLASGKLLGNYQDASSFATYERFAQTARSVQMAKYPELADKFRWGGYFGGGKGKYGALDTMHFDLGGAGMGGGTWEGGLSSSQRALWPGIESNGKAAVAALEKLAGHTGIAADGLGTLGTGFGEFGKNLTSYFPPAPSGGGSGGLFGWLSNLFGGGGGLSAIGQSILSSSSQFAGAWSLGGLGLYAKGGISDKPAIFGEAGTEAAVPLPDGRTIPVTLNVRSAYRQQAGSMEMVSARNAPIINNYGNNAVDYEEQTDERGNRQPVITIGEPVAAAIRQRGNPTRQALQSEFGLRPRRITR